MVKLIIFINNHINNFFAKKINFMKTNKKLNSKKMKLIIINKKYNNYIMKCKWQIRIKKQD